jgi:hypothetical protein
VKPFDRQHPIRGGFGDPRTVFQFPLWDGGLKGPGRFSFHNGVDISAPNGTPVYAVESGVVRLGSETEILLETVAGPRFQYFHVIPTVRDGERVQARTTLLGYVQAPYAHVHLAEIDGGSVTNPLRPGHLTPYADRTRPTIGVFEINDELGDVVGPLGLCGHVSIAAEISDRPSLPVPGVFQGLPVAPALVQWNLVRLGHGQVVPKTIAVDFRTTLPEPASFWDVYARGTYGNAPRFANQQFTAMPGRFLYILSRDLDTRRYRNGVYILTVWASDIAGNLVDYTRRYSILNVATATGCPFHSAPASTP